MKAACVVPQPVPRRWAQLGDVDVGCALCQREQEICILAWQRSICRRRHDCVHRVRAIGDVSDQVPSSKSELKQHIMTYRSARIHTQLGLGQHEPMNMATQCSCNAMMLRAHQHTRCKANCTPQVQWETQHEAWRLGCHVNV